MPFIRTSTDTAANFPDMVARAADLLDTARTCLNRYAQDQAECDTETAARHHERATYWFGRGFVQVADLVARARREELTPAEAIDFPARMEWLTTEFAELWSCLHPADQP